MSLDTYINLQEEVLAKLNRASDSEAILRCPTWVTLAEDELRMALTRLMVRQGETVNSSYSITGEYNALPAGFFRMRAGPKITSSNPTQTLDYVTPAVADKWDSLASPALPRLWTIQANQLRVFPPPNTTYTANLTYFALTSLSLTNATNWLLTAHPKVYFKAVLAEAYDFFDDSDNYDKAQADRDRMLSAIFTSDGSDQQGVAMRVRNDSGNP